MVFECSGGVLVVVCSGWSGGGLVGMFGWRSFGGVSAGRALVVLVCFSSFITSSSFCFHQSLSLSLSLALFPASSNLSFIAPGDMNTARRLTCGLIRSCN